MKVQLLIWCLLTALSTGAAWADDGAMSGIGGALQLMGEHPTIVMEQMLVEAKLTPERATIDCRFVFRNTGAATTVRMGFPESGYGDGSGGFTTFATWVDGVLTRTTIEQPKQRRGYEDFLRWRVKTVRFKRGETRRVRVRYTSPMGRNTSGDRSFSYAVGTGGSWKGPIGDAKITIHIEYEPSQYILRAGDDLVVSGPGSLVWHKRSFQPQPDAGITVSLIASRWQVHAGWRNGDLYPGGDWRVRDGQLWVAVRELANWLGAQVEWMSPDVRLLYGSRSVTIRVGDSVMQVDERQVALPGAPVISGNQLLVPVQPIAEALGCRVSASDRTTEVVTPLDTELAGRVGERSAADICHRLATVAAGWAPPEQSLYAKEALDFAGRNTNMPPWLAVGAFTERGNRDVALTLCKGKDLALLVAVNNPNDLAASGVFWVFAAHQGPLAPGQLLSVLTTHPPGEVAYWQELETTAKSGRLNLPYDGIELVVVGKAAMLYYWDNLTEEFRSVITAD